MSLKKRNHLMPMHFKSESAARAFLGIGSGGKAHGKSTKEANPTEAAFGDWLFAEKAMGRVLDYEFKPAPLKLADDCEWQPDYRHTLVSGVVVFTDVKGERLTKKRRQSRPWITGDAIVKLKCAAVLFPDVVVQAAWKRKATGEWLVRVFSPKLP